MKQIGIWLDKEKAHIVTLEDSQESFQTIESNIESYSPKTGNSGTHHRGGVQSTPQDSKYLEREKLQHKNYFRNLVKHVMTVNELAIFGPAETPERFSKHLEDHHPELNSLVRAVQKADSMTDNQVKALVRDFFQK